MKFVGSICRLACRLTPKNMLKISMKSIKLNIENTQINKGLAQAKPLISFAKIGRGERI